MDFPQFSYFPQEIQDQILAATVPAHQPTAHPVKLRTTVLPPEGPTASWNTVVAFHRRDDFEEFPADPEATIDALAALSAVSRSANATARRISKASGAELTRLRAPLHPEHSGDVEVIAAEAPLPAIRIDVAVDLLVLGAD